MDEVVSIDNFGGRDLINSPRSLEACLRSGYDPQELLIRDEKSFARRNEAAEVTQMRAEHFERKRMQKVEMVMEERRVIVDFLDEQDAAAAPETGGGGGDGEGAKSAVEQMKEKFDHEANTMMEMERKRLAQIQERMAKELQQMVEIEQRVADMQAKNAEKEKRERERREVFEKEKQDKRAELAAKRRERLVMKQKQEEEDEARAKELAKAEALQTKRFQEMEKKAEKQRKREARMRDQERVEKQEQHRREVEEMVAAQEEVAHQARLRMEERERVVKAAIERKQQEHKERIRAKRAVAEQRIASALKGQRDIQKKKRVDYDAKQAAAAIRAAEVKVRVDEETKANALKRDEELKQAKARKDGAKSIETDRIARILEKRAKLDSYLAVVHQERDRVRAKRNATKELRKEDKLSNVQRIKRIDEFVRLQTLQKIADDDDRSSRIAQEKMDLMNKRKQQTTDALKRKHEIAMAMEQMRISNKFGNLESLLKGKKGKKKKKKKSAGGDTLPSL